MKYHIKKNKSRKFSEKRWAGIMGVHPARPGAGRAFADAFLTSGYKPRSKIERGEIENENGVLIGDRLYQLAKTLISH